MVHKRSEEAIENKRLAKLRKLKNGDVVAVRDINPCKRETRDVNSRVLYVEHVPACEKGTVTHTPHGEGLWDSIVELAFKSAFYEP